MTYTFWHSGILIGESDLEGARDDTRLRVGIFRPTPYGIEIFPRLAGILSVAHALKVQRDAEGQCSDAMKAGELEGFLNATQVGETLAGIGRMLIDVEVRGPDGGRLECAALTFSDLEELKRVARELDVDAAGDLADLPSDAPRYIVSATFHDKPAASSGRGSPSLPRLASPCER